MRARFAAVLLVSAGCAGGSDDTMDNMGGTGGDSFGNAVGSGGSAATMHGNAGAPAPAAGSGGRAGGATGSGGTGAPSSGMSSGSGGSGHVGSGGAPAQAGSGGQGTAGAPSTGSGGSNGGSAGMPDDPFGGLLDPDAGVPGFDPDPNAPPPAAGQCADAFCFDVFDCAIFHPDLVGVCTFNDCVDFVCR